VGQPGPSAAAPQDCRNPARGRAPTPYGPHVLAPAPRRRTPRLAAVLALAVAVVVVLGGARWATHAELSEHGVRTVVIGDSITQADSRSVTGVPGEGSWLRHVVTDDRTPWRLVANVAVRGQRLDEMAARFAEDVLAREPAAVVIAGGTNDALQGVPVATSLRHLRAMVVAAQEAGAAVWVVAPLPVTGRTTPAGEPVDTTWLRAAQHVLVDVLGAVWVDASGAVSAPGGGWRAGATDDGVHPTDRGARWLGEAVLAQVAR